MKTYFVSYTHNDIGPEAVRKFGNGFFETEDLSSSQDLMLLQHRIQKEMCLAGPNTPTVLFYREV